ncbi:hypothetical protein THAOC_07868, partial [Thalassiosira oceanica]
MNATLAIAATTSLLGHGTLLDERRVFGSLIHRKLASEGGDGELHAYARGLRQKQRRQRLLGEGDCPGGAFLWKIVHDETNEHVGFGLGTVHVPTSEATSEATLASIMNAVDDSCDVYGELNIYSEDILDDIIGCMLSNDVGMDIGLLPGEIAEEYEELAKTVVDEFRGTLDAHVMAKPAGGVEDVSTQCDLLLDKIMNEGNVQRRRLQTELFANGDTDPLADLLAQELVHSYNCGNGEDIVALFDSMEGTVFDDMLLVNYQMAEAIASVLGSSEGKKVMFAFGLAHWILGDTSLDVMLKDSGYSLVHVPHWDEDDAVNFSNEMCGVEFNDDTELFQLMGDSVSSIGQVATPNVSGGETTSEVAATEGPVNQESSELSNPVIDGTADEPASVTSAATPAGFQQYVNP